MVTQELIESRRAGVGVRGGRNRSETWMKAKREGEVFTPAPPPHPATLSNFNRFETSGALRLISFTFLSRFRCCASFRIDLLNKGQVLG